MMKCPCAACLIVAILASSCATNGLKREGPSEAPLNGMVYDCENRPVADAEVYLDGYLRARSDIYGRFSLGEIRLGRYEVELRKNGCERSAFAVEYRDPTQIVYAKLVSSGQLLLMAEKEVERRCWAEALSCLDRVEALGEVDPAARYLRAVVLFRRGEAGEARAILESLLAAGYDEPHVHLFLADLLQHRLSDPAGAASQLQKYLRSRYDPDAERRLAALCSDVGR
jgi:hypothetical protein